MTLGELIQAFRDDMDDNELPPYWTTVQITRFLNQAVTEAARRARLIEDSETESDVEGNPICVFTVSTDDQFIALDSRIIQVKRVKLASKDGPLPKIHRADLDIAYPGWQDAASGDVVAYCPDFTKGKLYFFSKFDADDTVSLTVIREPLLPMADEDADSPEIAPRYHEALLDWVKYRALKIFDLKEKYDPVKAAEHLDAFEAEFGKRSSAIDEMWIEREQQYDGFDGTY